MNPLASCLPARALRSRCGEAGFTIVELVVAAGITAVMAGFIAAIVLNVSTSWSRAGARLGADAQARIVLDQLQLDLEGALFRDDGNVWFAADILNGSTGGTTGLWQTAPRNPKPANNLSLQLTAPDIANARFGTAGVWLRFFTTSRGANTAAAPATISAPVAVGYQIIRRFSATNPANTGTAYLLHRAEARPATVNGRIGVLEAGFTITSANYTTSTSGSNNGSGTGDPRSIQVPGTNGGAARNLDAVIADNVIDFGLRCYVGDATVPGGLRLTFPATATGALANAATSRLRASLPPGVPAAQWGTAQPFPDVVDIMIRILTDDGAEQIAKIVESGTVAVPQKYNGNAQEWWWGVALENSRVYTRRVVLNARSL